MTTDHLLESRQEMLSWRMTRIGSSTGGKGVRKRKPFPVIHTGVDTSFDVVHYPPRVDILLRKERTRNPLESEAEVEERVGGFASGKGSSAKKGVDDPTRESLPRREKAPSLCHCAFCTVKKGGGRFY
ncbi:hypothetical protein HNY73_023185 [Argiope bruennichi]|uniref:Uncharacterized protein n=1 Tax=Argiope bruennichi TaxID=94029 RepID=A0A8T0E4L9_ARGBR|nr:hypothetical protein HNY73_023185 [Argiope bruennichi]